MFLKQLCGDSGAQVRRIFIQDKYEEAVTNVIVTRVNEDPAIQEAIINQVNESNYTKVQVDALQNIQDININNNAAAITLVSNNLQDHVDSTQLKFNEIDTIVNTIEDALDEFDVLTAQHSVDIVSLQINNSANTAQIGANTSAIVTNTTSINTLNTNVAANTVSIDTLNTNVAANTSSIGTINSSITTINTKNISQDTSIATLNTNVTNLTTTSNSHTSSISSISANMATLTTNITNNTTSINTANTNITALQSADTNLQTSISSIQSANTINTTNISSLQISQASNVSRLNALEVAVAALQTAVTALQNSTTTEAFNTLKTQVIAQTNKIRTGGVRVGDILLATASNLTDVFGCITSASALGSTWKYQINYANVGYVPLVLFSYGEALTSNTEPNDIWPIATLVQQTTETSCVFQLQESTTRTQNGWLSVTLLYSQMTPETNSIV